jgi:hypothetical protein
MKIRADRDILLRDLGARGKSECVFGLAEISETSLRCWFGSQERSKCSPVHHARCRMLLDRKSQGVDVRSPGLLGVQGCDWSFVER